VDLARALAYQIGNLVNETELASRLNDRPAKTVYIILEILEKAYIIVRLTPYSNNPRQEIGKQSKIYFTDLGIRNALTGISTRWPFVPMSAPYGKIYHPRTVQTPRPTEPGGAGAFLESVQRCRSGFLEVEGSTVERYEIKIQRYVH